MTPDSLRQMLDHSLLGARAAVILEDGTVAFDLADSKYSISGEHNRCLLHLWSDERNIVRRVLDAGTRNGNLRLQVQRIGQGRPTRLEFCSDRDRRRRYMCIRQRTRSCATCRPRLSGNYWESTNTGGKR